MPAEIAALPSPRVAVLLGGPNGDYRYTPPRVAHLVSALQSLRSLGRGADDHALAPHAGRGGGLRARARRPGSRICSGMARARTPIRSSWRRRMRFIVPADSINMVGEPCATGKPVYVFEPEGGSPKFARFHDALRRHGATRPLPVRFERWRPGAIPRSIRPRPSPPRSPAAGPSAGRCSGAA